MIYVDTSVLVAALTPEPRTAQMQDWLAAQPAGQLAVSEWVVTEFSAALSVKLRTGRLMSHDRAEALAVFTEMIDTSFHLWAVSGHEFRLAARFADQYMTGLRAGDALHLAIAGHRRRSPAGSGSYPGGRG